MPENCELELFTEHAPPDLERLFGYQGSNQWVAFFWGKLVNGHAAGFCFDGKVFSPLNALAWDTFLSHPLMVAMNHKRINGHTVKRFDFGDENHTSEDCLLLDRRQRHLHAAQKPCAMEHLKAATQSETRDDGDSDPFLPPVFIKSNGRISSAPANSLQAISEMTAWLDDRMALLEQMGQRPGLS